MRILKIVARQPRIDSACIAFGSNIAIAIFDNCNVGALQLYAFRHSKDIPIMPKRKDQNKAAKNEDSTFHNE